MKRQLFPALVGALLMAATGRSAPPAQTQPAIRTLAAERGGQDLVGKPWPAIDFGRWINTDGNRAPDLHGSVVLYRWWTDTCPYCAKTLPGIEQLRKTYGPKGLKVVAVYHPKPPGDVPDERVLSAAKQIGYDGAIAVDPRWSGLKQVWLSTGRREATSASFLVDQNGTIRFVHPGTEYFPSDDPKDARQNSDYHAMDQAIRALLGLSN